MVGGHGSEGDGELRVSCGGEVCKSDGAESHLGGSREAFSAMFNCGRTNLPGRMALPVGWDPD